jgi:hypothetical protein
MLYNVSAKYWNTTNWWAYMKKKEGSRVSVTKKSYHLLLQLIPLLGHRPALFSQLYYHLFSLQTEVHYCFMWEEVLKQKIWDNKNNISSIVSWRSYHGNCLNNPNIFYGGELTPSNLDSRLLSFDFRFWTSSVTCCISIQGRNQLNEHQAVENKQIALRSPSISSLTVNQFFLPKLFLASVYRKTNPI